MTKEYAESLMAHKVDLTGGGIPQGPDSFEIENYVSKFA
jgi:hypothetical protein